MGSWLQEGSARLFVHTRVAPAPLPWGALVRACSPGAVLLHARSSPGGLGCASGAVHGAVFASGHASLNAGRLRAGWRSKDGGRRPRVFNFLQQSFRGIWHFSSGLKAQCSISPSLPVVLVLLRRSLCEVWGVGFGGTVSTRFEKAQKSLQQARVCRGEAPVECRLFPGGFNTKLRIVKSKNNICAIH